MRQAKDTHDRTDHERVDQRRDPIACFHDRYALWRSARELLIPRP